VTRAAGAQKKAATVRADARNAGAGNEKLRVHTKDPVMNSIVYLVGAVVIIVALLSFLGLR
jgi:predicted membrane channel-forming protein YqfA (hemolysin III family)